MAPRVKTRFPPSPTGALHLGGARTALFNWLYARHFGGQLVFRLEDTDRQRSKPEYVDSIIEAMHWLGMDYDEGPYYQTERFARYWQAVEGLLAAGKAYWCHCSAEEVQQRRDLALQEGRKPMYDGVCRELNLGPAAGAVVRFKGPVSGATTFVDLVKGPITFKHEELDDLVIWRSDGSPTYQLAVVVDDMDMGITHVIRGDDHISNTPRQILLFEALGAELPLFAHVPMILGGDKTKLSKRHGATAVVDYRSQGFLPEAMVNALARLGWSHGDQEIFSREELIKYFDLDAVGASAAVFDFDKLLKLNATYIQKADPGRLAQLLGPFLAQLGIAEPDQDILLKTLPHITPRGRTLIELAHWAQPYLLDEPLMEEEARQKFLTPANRAVLEKACALASGWSGGPAAELEQGLKDLAADLNMKLGGVAQPLRVALTGRTASPGIFEVMDILGPEKVKARLGKALELAKG